MNATQIKAVEKAIRENFPGERNASLRKHLRETAANGGSLYLAGQQFALSYSGQAGLEAVIRAAKTGEAE